MEVLKLPLPGNYETRLAIACKLSLVLLAWAHPGLKIHVFGQLKLNDPKQLPAELKDPEQSKCHLLHGAGCSRPAKHLLKTTPWLNQTLTFVNQEWIFEVNQGITWSKMLNWSASPKNRKKKEVRRKGKERKPDKRPWYAVPWVRLDCQHHLLCVLIL